MKKISIFLSMLILMLTLAGCTDLFDSAPTSTNVTFLTSSSTTTTTSNTIDKELILEDIYEIIYSDIYYEVKDEVLANLSEERFNQIYSQVIDELLAKVATGEIDITAADITAMIRNVEETTANSVVGISCLNDFGTEISVGSGVIYKQTNDKYYVVTNNHVVEDGASFEVVFDDGSRVTAILRGVDELVDLAVLYFVSEDTYEVADFADSEAVNKGDIVLAVGNPIGFDYFGSMTMGIVSGLDRYFDIDGNGVKDMFVNYIQHDAAINNGNSGGALFDTNGDVVGINVIKLTATEIEGMGFAIPSNLVSAICDDIEEYGYSKQKPVLGINFVSVSEGEDFFLQNGVTIPDEITKGFYVNSVVPTATLDGYVEPGDIITDINGIELDKTLDFIYEFSIYLVGDTISVTVYRNGEYITYTDIILKGSVE